MSRHLATESEALQTAESITRHSAEDSSDVSDGPDEYVFLAEE